MSECCWRYPQTLCATVHGVQRRGATIWMVGKGFLGVLGGAGSVGGVWFLGDGCDWSRVTEGRCASVL